MRLHNDIKTENNLTITEFVNTLWLLVRSQLNSFKMPLKLIMLLRGIQSIYAKCGHSFFITILDLPAVLLALFIYNFFVPKGNSHILT